MKTPEVCELFGRCLACHGGEHWQEFIDRYGRRVRRTVRLAGLRSRSRLTAADLDEIVQDLYCRLLSFGPRSFDGRSEAELWAFLSCVARNLIVDRKRASAARKRRPRASDPKSPSQLVASKPDPEEQLLGKESRRLFFEHCLQVARYDRVLLELRALRMAYLEGWSSREIARHLEHLSVGQVDALVLRLRRHLAKQGICLPRRNCAPVPVPVPVPVSG